MTTVEAAGAAEIIFPLAIRKLDRCSKVAPVKSFAFEWNGALRKCFYNTAEFTFCLAASRFEIEADA